MGVLELHCSMQPRTEFKRENQEIVGKSGTGF